MMTALAIIMITVLLLSETVANPINQSPSSVQLPNCAAVSTISGSISEVIPEKMLNLNVLSTLQFKLSLGETACFLVKEDINADNQFMSNKSVLYTVKYAKLEHHYPIQDRYEFGIPEFETKCNCDCPGGDDRCSPNHLSTEKCLSGLCPVHTFHPNQPALGCPVGNTAQVCCSIAIRPFNDWRFLSVTLGRPQYEGTFVHSTLVLTDTGQKWIPINRQILKMPLNELRRFDSDDGNMVLEVSAPQPHQRLSPGHYFTFANETRLRTGVPVNARHEFNEGKLGYYRRSSDTGIWTLRNSAALLQELHKVKVIDCKAQRLKQTFLAEQFAIADDAKIEGQSLQSFYLGQPIDVRETWILKENVMQPIKVARDVTIIHRGAHHVQMHLTLKHVPIPVLIREQAFFEDFQAVIRLDQNSNRFLNVTFVNGNGVIIGRSQLMDEVTGETQQLSISTSLGESTAGLDRFAIIDLAPTVNGPLRMCFHPEGRIDLQQCKWISFDSEPLSDYVVPIGYPLSQGDCVEECNNIGLDNWMTYLNPMQWLDGLSGTTETMAVLVEGGIFLGVILAMIVVTKKCLWPLFRCVLCPATCLLKKEEKRKSYSLFW